jgi:hypothetical protein
MLNTLVLPLFGLPASATVIDFIDIAHSSKPGLKKLGPPNYPDKKK